MAIGTGVGLFAMGVLVAGLSKVLAEEISAWSSCAIRTLIKLAVSWLPETQKIRFDEEWRSHIDEVPGHLGKIVCAFGLLIAARKISSVSRADRILEHWRRALEQQEEAHSKAELVVRVIQTDSTLAAREDLRALVTGLKSHLAVEEKLRNESAALLSDVSGNRGLLWSLALRLVRRRLANSFNRISQLAMQISASSERILQQAAADGKRDTA